MSRTSTISNPDWWERIGLFGCFLFASFAYLGTAPATAGIILFSLAFVGRVADWGRLGRDRLVVLCVIYAGYLLIHSAIFYLTAPSPALASEIARSGWDWAKLLLFIPFGYWAAGREQRVLWLLFMALIGFTLNIFRNIDWATFDAAFFSTRFGANLPANAFGMFTGIGILGLAATRERFWGTGRRGARRWLSLLLWVLLFIILAEGLVLSFSRGSWLAFAVASVLLIAAEWRAAARRKRGPNKTSGVGTAALFTLVLGALVGLNVGSIKDRLAADSGTMKQIEQGQLSAIPPDSAGLRLHVWRFALDKWEERPWFGWGAGSSYYLIEHSERPELRDGQFWLDHLHDTYLEALVQFGAVGFVLLTLVVWLLVLDSAKECRRGFMAADLCRLFAAAFVFVLVWNIFEYRVVRHDWTFFWLLFAGAAYSFRLRLPLEGARADQGSGAAP
ncbi:MAG: O-antigen ligase family protein [Chromatiaceae bacterium]